jgi:hypothetical protein
MSRLFGFDNFVNLRFLTISIIISDQLSWSPVSKKETNHIGIFISKA